jgi:predicted HicB family RNase H-like nuclease
MLLIYKGYVGLAQLCDDAHTFHGHVIDTKDTITFQGNLQEIDQAFRDSVDDYLEWCKELEEQPKT